MKPLKQVRKEDIVDAASKAGISSSQAERLWNLLPNLKKQIDFSHVFFFLGVIILLGAFLWMEMEGEDIYGPFGQFFGLFGFGVGISLLGIYLWRVDSRKIWGGWILTLALCLVPFITDSLFNALGWAKVLVPAKLWIFEAMTTFFVTSIALCFLRFPAFLIPLYSSLWVLTGETASLLKKSFALPIYSFDNASILFGIIGCLITWCIDRKNKTDFAFWGYLISVLALWTGLALTNYSSELWYFGYLLTSLLLIAVGVWVKRSVFFVFGALGILYYLIMVAYRHFPNSPMGFLILIAIALVVIALGIALQRFLKKRTKN